MNIRALISRNGHLQRARPAIEGSDEIFSHAGADVDARQLDAAERIGLIFRDIFEIEVGADDDFFDLGGDSLTGETLLTGIERDLGVALPLSILLESSTPRSLANRIGANAKAAPSTILFTVSDKGSGTPVFCIHGSDGTAAFSRKFRDVLSDRPIYAIRALGMVPGEIPLTSAHEMARTYIREIRRVRPSGPYHIFGQCGTANVAYEVAQQLSEAGEVVKTVTLGDPKRLRKRLSIHRLKYRLMGRHAMRIAHRFPQMSGADRLQKIIEPALMATEKDYVPRPYSGWVLVVAASDNVDELLHPERGYPALVPNLETAVVADSHYGVFSREAGKLTRAMASFLARHD